LNDEKPKKSKAKISSKKPKEKVEDNFDDWDQPTEDKKTSAAGWDGPTEQKRLL